LQLFASLLQVGECIRPTPVATPAVAGLQSSRGHQQFEAFTRVGHAHLLRATPAAGKHSLGAEVIVFTG